MNAVFGFLLGVAIALGLLGYVMGLLALVKINKVEKENNNE